MSLAQICWQSTELLTSSMQANSSMGLDGSQGRLGARLPSSRRLLLKMGRPSSLSYAEMAEGTSGDWNWDPKKERNKDPLLDVVKGAES
jgi:hypothetical protein